MCVLRFFGGVALAVHDAWTQVGITV